MWHQQQIVQRTGGRGAIDLTAAVSGCLERTVIQTGLCHVFVHHTSASLMLCENADPDVLRDLETWMSRTVPDADPDYVHTAEGPDDMPAHVRSILTGASLCVPIRRGRLDLGTWQGIFLLEHRTRSQERRLTITLNGSADTDSDRV